MIVISEPLETIIVNTIVEIKSRLGETKIKGETIHEILKDTLEIVEKLDIKGEEKREIVIKVIKKLVDDLVDDDEEKKLINDMIDKKILSNTIDLIILGSKGKLDLNNSETHKKIVSFGKNILHLLLFCCKRRSKNIEKKQEINVEITNN